MASTTRRTRSEELNRETDLAEFSNWTHKPPRPSDDVNGARKSALIDEELRKEAIRRKEAQRREVKVMLLGQAESGKSTLQKQFQLYYASHSLDHERPAWIPIVYFNIIKAVRMILDELEYNFSRSQVSEAVLSELNALRPHLQPLVDLEDQLASDLNGGVSISGGRTGVFVRSGWQALVTPTRSKPISVSTARGAVMALAARTLLDVQEYVEQLWEHSHVQSLLALRQVRLDESAPFFLNDIKRIAAPDYMPSTDDILNVRLQTLGVVEHSFTINMGTSIFKWLVYDVGGARGQRATWVPYFDDATALIYLAPMSAFDQYLEEDPRTNRIDDSLQLFTALCSNKLLKNCHLVLMLNKADLLKKKLEAGIRVKDFITSYGDRPNDYESVASYFRAHFLQIHRRKDIGQRSLFTHYTSMLDIKATQSIIANVGDVIIRSHIATAGLA